MTKKIKQILVSSLIILLGAMLSVAGVIAAQVGGGGIDGGKREKQICSIYATYETVKVNAFSDDVIIKLADTAGPRVMAYEQQNVKISVRSDETGVLTVEKQDSREWFEKLTIGEQKIPIVIYLSKGVSVDLVVVTDSGNVTVEENVKCENVSVTSKSGDIKLLSTPSGSVKLTTTGEIVK